jgi:hypothetical protein
LVSRGASPNACSGDRWADRTAKLLDVHATPHRCGFSIARASSAPSICAAKSLGQPSEGYRRRIRSHIEVRAAAEVHFNAARAAGEPIQQGGDRMTAKSSTSATPPASSR